MKVALVNPPWSKPGCYGVRAGSRWPHLESQGNRYMPFPFFLAYAAALLERRDFDVAIFDGCATKETERAFLDRVVAFAPEVVVQENATASIGVDLRWARTLKQQTGAFVLMTGHHVARMRDELAGDLAFIDALAGGEWEQTVVDCAERIRAGDSLRGVAGLSHRDPSGRVIHEERRPNIADLDALPFPHRATLDMSRYHDNPGGLPDPCLQLLGSRGCPFSCNFCVWPQVVYEDRRYRARSAGSIIDEIDQAFRVDPFPYRAYYFDDDTFNIGKRRLVDLADGLIERGLEHIPWGAMCRADTWDEHTLTMLHRAGLRAVKYGVESGSQDLLDRCGKQLDLSRVRRMVGFTKALGIKVHLTFSFGLIGETEQTMQKTLALALELDGDTVQFSICTPFPGTKFYDYAVERGLLLTTDYSAYDGSASCVVRTEALSAERLEKFVEHARRSWLLHRIRRHPGAAFALAASQPLRAIRRASSSLWYALRGDGA